MHKLIFAVFENPNDVNSALDELNEFGVTQNDVSVVVQDSVVKEKIHIEGSRTDNAVTGATGGAATGGTVGALVGLLAGMAVITIPGLGAILVGGPLLSTLGITGAAATTISGAVTGALAGGLLGALVGLGVPKKEAEIYESRVKAGNILLIIKILDIAKTEQVETVLRNNSAKEINFYTGTSGTAI